MAPFEELAEAVREAALSHGVDVGPLPGEPSCWFGCGTPVARSGQSCRPCVQRRVTHERREALLRAWRTVPRVMAWATLEDGPLAARLAAWVPDRAAVDQARGLARRIAEGNGPARITLVGPASAGKTTLACALLREHVRRGAAPKARPGAVYMAQRARYQGAQDLVLDRSETPLGEHVPSLDLSHRASVLLLDEVGRGLDSQQVVFGLLHARHREDRPTIVTTPYPTQAALAEATRDAGLARRVFEDCELIEVRKS